LRARSRAAAPRPRPHLPPQSCRTEYGPSQPFKGARIAGSLHMTIQTGVCVRACATSHELRATRSLAPR